MDNKYTLISGKHEKMGAWKEHNDYYFTVQLFPIKDCGIIIYGKQEENIKISFSNEFKIGSVYAIGISKLPFRPLSYEYYVDDQFYLDPYSKQVIGNEVWGKKNPEKRLKSAIITDDYSWGNDHQLNIAYDNCLIYCLHVRGFTKHRSSNVMHKGTFMGLIEKIPYLKQLGITTLELMPCYEFEEVEYHHDDSMNYMNQRYESIDTVDATITKKTINYWGYKKASYFAPKASFCSDSKNAMNEFKQMVSLLHKENIEIMMQIYFPDCISQNMILDVLKYWVIEYHVDGFHLKGNNIPMSIISCEPLLSNTKILYYYVDSGSLQREEANTVKHLAVFKDDFLIDSRKFLKGDEGMVETMLDRLRCNPSLYGMINYITNYEGFTLMDLVSYERKHNEQNGEDNKDGNDYNYSWNCGQEGVTRRKAIIALRYKQVKNAMLLCLLAQGTPFLLSGDEFLQSRKGNNNPYCQDNSISWLNWNLLKTNEDFYTFTKNMIALRKKYKHLHAKEEYTLSDGLRCSFPDLSYHSDEAWRIKTEQYRRQIGLLYSGQYHDKKEDIYIAFNMHWEESVFALPNMGKQKKWYLVMDTNEQPSNLETPLLLESNLINVKSRSIQILISK